MRNFKPGVNGRLNSGYHYINYMTAIKVVALTGGYTNRVRKYWITIIYASISPGANNPPTPFSLCEVITVPERWSDQLIEQQ